MAEKCEKHLFRPTNPYRALKRIVKKNHALVQYVHANHKMWDVFMLIFYSTPTWSWSVDGRGKGTGARGV